jgi:hypothetical protein
MEIKEIFKKYANNTALTEGHYGYMMDEESFTEASKFLISFHVEQALKAASEKAVLEVENYKRKHLSIEESLDNYTDCRVNKDSILNAYPPENIK